MLKYKKVTAIAERTPHHTERLVCLPRLTNAPFPSKEYDEWVEKNWWMVDYSVFMGDKGKAQALASDLEALFRQDPDHPAIPKILRKLKRMRSKSLGELTALEMWTRSAHQLAWYSGEYYAHKAIVRKLSRYSGTVLEAMCGHVSYFDESPGRTVTALDFCRASLERYPFPEGRLRIECDLDQVKGSAMLPFFCKDEFDAVSICFGYKYPRHIGPLVREFRRILKPGGKLSFVENPQSAYERYTKRKFDTQRIRNLLLDSGYRTVDIKIIRVRYWQKERGDFYHVEATK